MRGKGESKDRDLVEIDEGRSRKISLGAAKLSSKKRTSEARLSFLEII